MKAETLEALKGSIEKWRRIVEEQGNDEGCDNCPLCDVHWSIDCDGCPVREATGYADCIGSPYAQWADAGGTYGTRCADTDERMIAARAELEFLHSLLPKEGSE